MKLGARVKKSALSSKRRQTRKGVPLLAAAALILSGCVSEAEDGNTTNIRLADSYSTKHAFAEYGVSVFIDAIVEEGMTVDYFPAGQMGNAQDLEALVSSQNLDIAPASPAYLEDKYPLASVGDLPNWTEDACVATNAMSDLMDPGGILFEEEFKPRGLRPLWVAIIPGYELMTSHRPVEFPSDVEGLLMRSSGGAFDVTTSSIGAAAVSLSAADTYEAMARNTVDGTSMPYSSAVTYNLEEVAHYSTDGLNVGAVGIPYVISEESWQALGPGEQEAILVAADDVKESLCAGLNKEREESKEILLDAGVELTVIEGEAAEEWEKELSEVRQAWADSFDDIGKPGTEVLNAYEEAVESYERSR